MRPPIIILAYSPALSKRRFWTLRGGALRSPGDPFCSSPTLDSSQRKQMIRL